MTGDGVNDGPALKRADIGIAVQGSTDAARAAADIVLTEPGLSVIIDAIVLSRKIFHRMKNYVTYRIACTIQLLLFFFIAILSFSAVDSKMNVMEPHEHAAVPMPSAVLGGREDRDVEHPLLGVHAHHRRRDRPAAAQQGHAIREPMLPTEGDHIAVEIMEGAGEEVGGLGAASFRATARVRELMRL